MMKNRPFDVPILFIIFRRKDTALKVIEAIAKVKPKKLYVSQDGPRNDREKQEVMETRKAVLSKINWDCDLTVWTHDKNLGLKKHIPEAFDKFFEKEEHGIYLEDDTLPSKDFFYFQRELLEKYKDDERIFSINGTNFYPELVKPNSSYYLSKIGDIWGFGLWKRSWKLYNSTISDFNKISKSSEYKNYFFSRKYKFYLETFWNAIRRNKLDSWAMQLVYAAIKNNMFFIAPSVNMVNNVGENFSASNVSLQIYQRDFSKLFPMRHPKELLYIKTHDLIYFNNMLKGGWFRILPNRLYLSLPILLRKNMSKIISYTRKT
jgi:hypothetical protein